MNISYWFGRLKSIVLLQNTWVLYRLPPFTRAVRQCPVCAGPGTYEARNAFTRLDRCGDCSHVYSYRQPNRRILSLMYRDTRFWVMDKDHQGIHDVAYGPHWKDFLAARTGIMLKTGVLSDDRPRRVFEIGCSEGILLKELERQGHTAIGCEMNPATSGMGKQALGVDIRVGPFESCAVEDGAFDAVVSFHTIEHLRDLRYTMNKIASMLKPDGALLVEVPTGPEEYHNVYHLHFFEEASLRRLLEAHFEESEILPNEFVDARGNEVKSLYGVGRRPRNSGARQRAPEGSG